MTDMAYNGNERSKKRKKEVDDEDLDDILDPDLAFRNRSVQRKEVGVDESAHGCIAGTRLTDFEAWERDYISRYDSPGDHPIRQRRYATFDLSQEKLFDINWKKVLEEIFPHVELTTKAFKKECVEKRDGPPSEMYENLDVAISTLVEDFSRTVPSDFLDSIRRFREDNSTNHPDPKLLRELDKVDDGVLLKASSSIVILQMMLMSMATKTNKGSANKGVITERVCYEVFKEKHVGGGTKHGKLMLIEELFEWLKRDFPCITFSPQSRGSRR